jgi:hypothetical protein
MKTENFQTVFKNFNSIYEQKQLTRTYENIINTRNFCILNQDWFKKNRYKPIIAYQFQQKIANCLNTTLRSGLHIAVFLELSCACFNASITSRFSKFECCHFPYCSAAERHLLMDYHNKIPAGKAILFRSCHRHYV